MTIHIIYHQEVDMRRGSQNNSQAKFATEARHNVVGKVQRHNIHYVIAYSNSRSRRSEDVYG